MINTTSSTLINKSGDKFKRFPVGRLTLAEQTEIEVETREHFRFAYYSEKWKKETQFVSSPSIIINNTSYQEIIKMGKGVVPFIFNDLRRNQKDPHFWFPALQDIIGNGPTIPEDVRGNMPEIARIWILWIEENVPCSD